MIRTSKHNISNETNSGKVEQLSQLFVDYKLCLKSYIDLILKNKLPLKTNLSSNILPTLNLKHSKYKRICYKQASEVIRSCYKKSKEKRYYHYKKIYSYMAEHHPNHKFVKLKYSKLNLKDLIKTKYFIKPNVNNITINLTDELYNIKEGNSFDSFIKITLSEFNEKGTRALSVNVPLK